MNQLCVRETASSVFDTVAFRHRKGVWNVRMILLMPDHVHGLIAFPLDERMKGVVAKWKEYVAKKIGISWQRDFFDHRIRDVNSLEEKEAYILNNPVRKGLVENSEEWPYVWRTTDFVD